MPSKYEFDQTRDSLGVDKLDDKERKAMLDKFKQGGGKVLSEKELQNQKAGGSSKSARKIQVGRGGDAGGRGGNSSSSGDDNRQTPGKVVTLESQKRQLSGFFPMFFLKLKAAMAGVAPFGGLHAQAKFISYLGLEFKQALVEFNLIGNDLFLRDKKIGNKIAKELDKKNPLFMEVLQAAHSLYEFSEYNKLMEFHTNQPDINVPFSTIDQPLKSLFRKLYTIYPYQETLRKAFTAAVEIYKADPSNVKDKDIDQKKKRFYKDVSIVFLDVFPKIFLLISRIDGVSYPPFSPLLEKSLGIASENRLGKRKAGESLSLASDYSLESDDELDDDDEFDDEDQDDSDDETDEEDEENQVHATKEYQYGLGLMKTTSPEFLRKKYAIDKDAPHLKNNDRALLAYLFFMEFDHELSFVLTTKKIHLESDFSSGRKVDYKQILADIYNESRNIIQNFQNYAESRKELINLEKQGSGTNYVEASKRKEKYKIKMDMEARNLRGTIRSYMSNVSKNMAILIADMKADKKIVGNMDAPVEFDSELEGSKRLNKQPVKQCILEAYCYSLALSERLSTGDLFGGIIEMTDEEMISSFGQTFTTP